MLRHVLTWPLSMVPTGTVVPVLSGPNRGYRWPIGHGVHRYWTGRYDPPTQRRLAAELKPGDVAFDIGAHYGFFTLLMARLVGPSGHVHAFEALPANVALLREHLALNQIGNVTVHPVAVTDHSGTVAFVNGPESSTGRIAAGGSSVPAVALDDLDLPAPRLIKMDIEGGEHLALCGMTSLLRRARPILLIEGH